jgi:hypothetical protein
MLVREFIESNRQTGTTTSLVNLVRENNGWLIVGTLQRKIGLQKQFPEIKENILSISELTQQKRGWVKRKIFFDTDAVCYLNTQLKVQTIDNGYVSTIAINGQTTSISIDFDAKTITQHTCSRPQDGYVSREKEIEAYLRKNRAAQDKIEKIQAIVGTPEESLANLKSVDGYARAFDGYGNNKQLNIKLTEEDMKEINEINKLFFENEASLSMLGRIILRKGFQAYKKLVSVW